MTQLIHRALVVDDSRLARIALSKLLQKRGVEVEVVGTGSEALNFLNDQRLPDVVFMDYMMPDMDGFEASQQIRDAHADAVPIVMYTSQDTADDREKARQLGIAGFLSKPSGEHNLDDVLTQLNTVLADRPASEASGAAAEPAASVAAAASDSAETPEPVDPPEPAVSAEPAETLEPTASAEPAEIAISEPSEPSGPESAAAAVQDAYEEYEPAPVAAEEPAASEPVEEATGAAPSAAVPDGGEAVRPVAREVAQEVVEDAMARFAREQIEPLQRQMGDTGAEQLLEQAREAARTAAEEAAETVADRTARQIAENVAQETASRVSEEVGPEAAKRIMSDVRKDVKGYVSELLGSDAFKNQITEVVRDTAWPAIQQKVTEQVVATSVRKAETAARQAAADEVKSHSDEASDVAGRLVDERVAALRATLNSSTKETVDESLTGIKRVVYGLAGVLGLGVVASFVFTFMLAG